MLVHGSKRLSKRIFLALLCIACGAPRATAPDLKSFDKIVTRELVAAAFQRKIPLSFQVLEHDNTRINVSGQRLANSRVRITFGFWGCRVLDWYHFDYDKRLTLPNPDYGSRSPDAVRKQDRTLVVYHSNARRIERAGLAAPYHSASIEWPAQGTGIAGPGEVDPSRRL